MPLLSARPSNPAALPLSIQWREHLDALRECRRCPEVHPPPVVGAVPGSRIYLVGQAPGPREASLGQPFAWTAGKTLFKWFASLGVEEAIFRQRVYMAAAIRCFPGKIPGKTGDRKPSPSEIETCAVHRKTELTLLQPELVIPVGRLAIELFVECPSLDEVIGKRFAGKRLLAEHRADGFDVIPLPHPSGLSRWIQTPRGKAKVKRALRLIDAHPAWRATFGPGGA